MSYNIKIKAFGNGEVEVCTYKQGVRQLSDPERAYEADERDARGKAHGEIAENNLTYNPFTDKVEWLTEFESVELDEYKKQHSLMSSLNRTRSALYDYSRQCKWEYFITLTFSPDKVDRYDFVACMSKACKWIMNQRNRNAPLLKYVLVPEQHKDGAWHVHGVLCDTGRMVFVDSGKRCKGQVIYNLSGWKYGFSTATAVTNTYKVSAYIVKYITKELCAVTAGRQRYYVSKSIPKPEVITEFVDPKEMDSYIQTIADSFGADLEYQKSISGYLDVDYRYYKCKAKEEEEHGEKGL